MSIKQNGGVFGRNPTFNDVTIEGNLIINGEVFTGLDFQGSWNASTNTPALASSTGTNGEFYIVSVAGSTNLNGITNWGIGDWAIFNGTVWQRVEGGADGNFNDLTAKSLHLSNATNDSNGIKMQATGWAYTARSGINGTSGGKFIQSTNWNANTNTVDSASQAATAIIQDATTGSIQFNTATTNTVPAERMRIDSAGHAIIPAGITLGTAAGVYSAANTLDDYEEGTWTPAVGGTWTTDPTALSGTYTKIGRLVTITLSFSGGTKSSAIAGYIDGLPFAQSTSGTGAVTDAGVNDKGIALIQNVDRVWLTETAFNASTYVLATYTTTA